MLHVLTIIVMFRIILIIIFGICFLIYSITDDEIFVMIGGYIWITAIVTCLINLIINIIHMLMF